ncbi:MAG: glutamate-1-semialdehyde 2,1-aminomutase [bacterium]
MNEKTLSAALLARAEKVMPGGVSSPVRAWKGVGGHPPFIAEAHGCRIMTEDGEELVDFVGSWGPMLLGHSNEGIVRAVREVAGSGTSFGAPTALEVDLAERIVERVPSVEMVRFVNSGTEATMSALRLARAATSRPIVMKFAGAYHGHADAFLIEAGSGPATFGTPTSPGVTEGVARDTRNARFNDPDSVREIFAANPGQVAAIIAEPVVGNSGCIPPDPGFLAFLREICDREGALLILDEVMTGLRVARGGAQELYDVRPDLTTLGKVIGGGLPVGAYGGRADLMRQISPDGPVYQAGTLSGNPLAMAAGLAMLDGIDADPELYPRLERLGARLSAGMQNAIDDLGLGDRLAFQRVASMFCLYFAPGPVRNWDDAARADRDAFSRWFHGLWERGYAIAPSGFEAGFLSSAHGEAEIDGFVQAARESLADTFGGSR